MKKKYLIFLLIPIIAIISGCKNDQLTDKGSTNMNIYEYLLEGNQKYGSDKTQICKSTFKCEPQQIQEKVIIAPTWEVDIFSSHVSNIEHISGPTGHGYNINELDINGKKITHITTGIGACNILDATLALGCTPCKEIVFIGSAGALSQNMKIGDIIIPEYSICGVGTNRYLTSGSIRENDTFGKKYYPNKEFYNEILSIANEITKDTDIKIHLGKTYSADTIFAQYAHLEEIINMGCNSIEMEIATFFDAANVANIKATAIFNISDNTIDNKSLYNGRTDEDQIRRGKSKKEIMPVIALKTLKVI